MKTILIIIISFLTLSNFAYGQSNVSASVSIPKGSGLAVVGYTVYQIDNAELYVMDKYPRMNFLDTTEIGNEGDLYHYDTIASYPVSIEDQNKLKELIIKTDSLGSHTANGCLIESGWPRFFINASYNDKNLSGFVSNCYREHIFQFIDLFNEFCPNGDAQRQENLLNKYYQENGIIIYKKEELIQLEKDCNKRYDNLPE